MDRLMLLKESGKPDEHRGVGTSADPGLGWGTSLVHSNLLFTVRSPTSPQDVVPKYRPVTKRPFIASSGSGSRRYFLESASKTIDNDVVLVLCHHAEAALSRMKRPTKKASASTDPKDQALRERMAAAYFDLGKLMDNQEYQEEAEAFYKKAQKME
ncbi:hypothetical protein B0O80DRAFT_431109 [Mortierella sp. GBAus27b]|nr:hypothetical protein B0O80DRAFT_431109 [Mortierella sp. GBAus27b]